MALTSVFGKVLFRIGWGKRNSWPGLVLRVSIENAGKNSYCKSKGNYTMANCALLRDALLWCASCPDLLLQVHSGGEQSNASLLFWLLQRLRCIRSLPSGLQGQGCCGNRVRRFTAVLGSAMLCCAVWCCDVQCCVLFDMAGWQCVFRFH